MDHIKTFGIYLETEERRAPATVRGYLADVRQLRVHLDAETQPQDRRGRDWAQISAADLRGFLAATRPKPHRIHRLLASWSKFWLFLREVQHLDVGHPPGEIKRPKLPGRLPKYLDTPDIARLLKAAFEDDSPDRALRDWALLAFLYGTGARISEVLNLTFDRITTPNGLPTSMRVIGKGDRERMVPLSATAQRALVQWLRVRRTEDHSTRSLESPVGAVVRPAVQCSHHPSHDNPGGAAGRARSTESQPAQDAPQLRHSARRAGPQPARDRHHPWT